MHEAPWPGTLFGPRGPRRSFLAAGLALLCMGMAASPGYAQAQAQADYPNRPLTFVVPYPAAGAADVFARQLAAQLATRLGQAVVVENRAGANGNLGSASVVKGLADGYTLLLGTLSTVAINPALYGKNMPYDTVRDLLPVSATHDMANVLVVPASSPFKTVQDVVAAAKARPGTVAYASAGNGNSMHLAGEQLALQAGISLIHVPYKGGPPALTDVLGGQVPMMFNNLPAVLAMVRSGKLRALAIAAAQRSPLLPEVPTMEEAGFKGFVSTVWSGVFVRSSTPRAAVQRLNRDIVAALNSPEMRRSLEEQGYEGIPSTPEEFAARIHDEVPRWAKLVQQSGVKLD